MSKPLSPLRRTLLRLVWPDAVPLAQQIRETVVHLVPDGSPEIAKSDDPQNMLTAALIQLKTIKAAGDSQPHVRREIEQTLDITEPTEAARLLMDLCDMLWAGQTGGTGLQAHAVERLYQRICDVLGSLGVITLDEVGSLHDSSRQRIVGTAAAYDPSCIDCVERTVRPGFLLAGRILRPQEVIVVTE